MNHLYSVEQGYNLWAQSYDRESNILIALDDAMEPTRIKAMDLAPTSTGAALDIGCGTGRHIPILERHFRRVVGLDLSPKMLDQAGRKITGSDTWLYCGDFLKTELPGPFDFIHSSLALMHISNLDGFFSQITRNLTDDGVFYLVDADESRLRLGTTPNFRCGNVDITVTHQIIESNSILEGLTKAGLSLIESGKIPCVAEVCNLDPKFARYRNQAGLFYFMAKKTGLK